MKKRILTFLSMFVLIGINAWADTDLATLVKDAAVGSTVKLTEDVSLTQTVTIDKDLTLDIDGHAITAINCRAFNITAGNVKIINSGGVKISLSIKTLRPLTQLTTQHSLTNLL